MQQTEAIGRFSGVHAILYAFFDRLGQLDLGSMEAQIDACLALEPDGMAVLGLATEVEKLAFAEKRRIVELTARRIAGRIPLAVTIGAPSAEERSRLIALAADHDASWMILQPPPEIDGSEAALVEAFSAMMAETDRKVAI